MLYRWIWGIQSPFGQLTNFQLIIIQVLFPYISYTFAVVQYYYIGEFKKMCKDVINEYYMVICTLPRNLINKKYKIIFTRFKINVLKPKPAN